jgi:pyridoxamine 5'-phosphate oxidase
MMSDESTEPESPFERFRAVFALASATGMRDPNAMVVTSVAADGQPSSRVVLLKELDEHGFVFFTNLESRKGREILGHPQVSLSFFWREIQQQVTVLGRAERVTDAEADTYFATRPRGSQIGAWASRQSRPLPSREKLLQEVAAVEERFSGSEVPRPPHWSGFRVVPSLFEFWIAGEFRLHDRTRYERAGDAWRWSKLYP